MNATLTTFPKASRRRSVLQFRDAPGIDQVRALLAAGWKARRSWRTWTHPTSDTPPDAIQFTRAVHVMTIRAADLFG